MAWGSSRAPAPTGITRAETNGHSGAGTTDSTTAGTVGSGMSMGDTETGEFREHAADDEGVHQSRGDDLADEDELRSSALRRSSGPVPASVRPAP